MFYVECQKCVAILMITMYFFFPLTEAKRTDPSEVKALGDIRSNLNDPMKYLNWTKGDPCTSNWTGVSCYNTTHGDSYLHVQELQLLNMNLSGNLAPELGKLSYMEIMNFMWNKLSGIIPKQIGNIKSLKLLLLNGNELSGNLPEEIGNLLNLERLQIDENQISGSLPVSFANLTKVKHIHMNNNSINGQIPKEFSQLPNILFILLDNNNLSGDIPPELSMLSTLRILQLDNNNFNGASIPSSFGNMIALFKLSLRNCSLQGLVPDLSRITQLGYLDLSWNQLNGTIPPKQLSKNITTIDLSNNKLSGPVPENFSGLPLLQKLSLKKNILNGSVASEIWKVNFSSDKSLILDFQNNDLNSITGDVIPPSNVSIMLQGNPICENITQNIAQFCGPQHTTQSSDTTSDCLVPKDNCPVEDYFECNCAIKVVCVCQAPIEVGYRLKSPGISDFRPYTTDFVAYLTSELDLYLDQLYIDSYIWEEGPRLSMFLKIFPINSSDIFNETEILRIRRLFLGWKITYSDIFGPYEVLNFTPSGYYKEFIPTLRDSSSTLSKGAIVGIIVGIIAAAITSTAICSILVFRRKVKHEQMLSRKRKSITASRIKIKIDGVKDFTFKEISQATNNFSNSTIIGQGGYGIVYKGILHDGTEVAVKRAKEGSLQGSKEFYTEIELLSRLHHRNLVSLFGYCDEVGEQMLVYEFMSNSSLRDHLPAKLKEPLSFFMRLRIALGSAKGILYLHTEVNPPIFHRDIKPANILLDDKFTAKVADFGISRFAPELDAQGLESSHISTVVKGTPGYLDPEYFLTDTLTDKSDVYSLGIVFLELLTGLLPASHGRNIVREVNIACQSSGGAFSIIDKEMGDYPSDCVEKFLMLALRCCHDEPSSRPSMAEVVREVENIKLVYLEEHSIPSTSTNIEAQTDIVSVTSSSVRTGVHSYSNYNASSLPNSDVHPVVPR